MIIKGNPGGNVGWWANHLLREDTNDRAEVKEISGLLSEDLPRALREMEALASGSRSHGNFMYCANINPLADERLTEEQWREAVDTLEKNMGLEGHQRIVVEHEKEGRTHRHIVWNRVDAETLRVVDVGGNYYTHERTEQELARRFGLTVTPSPNREEFRELSKELWEIRAEERSGIKREDVKADLTELWRSTDSGQAFAAALDERGYILAKGDRRDFCAVDQAGTAHSLARRIEGAKAHDVREHMADIDRDSLPTVAEAREQQRSRSRDAAREATPEPEARAIDATAAAATPAPPGLGKTAAEIRLAWSLSKSADGFAAALDERGMTLARVDAEEARASERAHAFAKEVGNYSPRYAEGELVAVNGFGGVTRLNERTTGQTPEEVAKYLSTIDPRTLLNVSDARAALKEAARLEFIEERQEARPWTKMETRIHDLQQSAPTAGAFAALLYQEGITLARADAAGIDGLAAEHRAAFIIDDRLTYAPTVKEGELVAVNRFGGVHRLNPHKLDIEGIELALTGGNKTIPALSDARDYIAAEHAADKQAYEERSAEFWQGVEERREAARDAKQESWRASRDAEIARVDGGTTAGEVVRDGIEGGLSVAEKAGAPVVSLGFFILDFLSGGSAPQPPRGTRAQIAADRRASAALESIRESMENGWTLKAEDIRSLPLPTLEGIRRQGDDYLRQKIAEMESERARDRDGGRERER